MANTINFFKACLLRADLTTRLLTSLDTPLFLHPVLPALHLENPDVPELLMLFDSFQLAQK